MFVSCGIPDEAKRAINSFEIAAQQANKKGADLIGIIEGLRKEIPDEIHKIIGNDLAILSRDVGIMTTTQAFCTIDFIGARVESKLYYLAAKIRRFYDKNAPLRLEKPTFCGTNILALDLSNDISAVKELVFNGYNLNSPDSARNLVRAVLVGRKDRLNINEEYIGRNSDYNMVVNVAALLPELVTNKYQKLKLIWGNDSSDLSEVVIKPYVTQVKVIPTTCMPITFTPPHTGGDADFDTSDGNWTNYRVFIQTRLASEKLIQVRVFMGAMEFGGDNTTVGYHWSDNDARAYGEWRTLYELADPNYKIVGLSPEGTFENTKIDGAVRTHGPQPPVGMAGSLVSNYVVQIDRDGDEAGEYTNVNVTFNDFKVTVESIPPARNPN